MARTRLFLLFMMTMMVFNFTSFYAEASLLVHSKSWNSAWRSTGELKYDVQALISKLSQSQIGARLIKNARKVAHKKSKSLVDLIDESEASYTDYTVRKISHDHIVSSKKIFLDRNTLVKRAVYDLAHELVHFIWQENLNPFDLKNEYADYLKNNIEGIGGEIEAFMIECKVAKQLHPDSWKKSYPCQHITHNGKISRRKAVETFYKVGHDHKAVNQVLAHDHTQFPHLSAEPTVLVAGTSSTAYPVSILKEFVQVRQQLCLREKRKIKASQGRRPASVEQMKVVETVCQFSP